MKKKKKKMKKSIPMIAVTAIMLGLVVYAPIKIKHNALVKNEVQATERFDSQMKVIEDFKNVRSHVDGIYTTEEKMNEINTLISDISFEVSNGITEKLEELVSKLKIIVNDISASNEMELELHFNKINDEHIEGLNEDESGFINGKVNEYNNYYKQKDYNKAKVVLEELEVYINSIKKVANERKLKNVYDEKSSEDASTREPKYVNGILVVNKENGLPDTFAPGESVEARDSFEKMKADAELDGIYIQAFSTYRSYWYQDRLYSNYVSNYGQEPTDTFSARAGFSEHQTGLAFDIGGLDRSLWAENDFKYTDEAKWLKENSYKYGFILRYPEGKEWKTGFMHESWHFRYIGVEHSKNFANNDLTLEEYLGL
ncbi:M15 family metallopeptidase [Clostridium sp.]|uniref:M15 family metallopeptidase n=1 Tax=Clostridium sp. TaxID=1506 RepID=UPI003F3FB9FD